MGPVLAHIADLDGVVAELVLHRPIPLLGNRGLHVRVPDPNQGLRERVAGRADRSQTISRRGSRQRNVVVLHQGLSLGEGWIDGEAQVRARPFEIRRDTEGAAEYRLSSQTRRRPGKADARLKVFRAIRTVVEAAVADLLTSHRGSTQIYLGTIGRKQLSGEKIEIDLLVMRLYPGSVGFVAQAKVDGEVLGGSPVVLNIPGKNIRPLAPLSGRNTFAVRGGQTKVEIGSAIPTGGRGYVGRIRRRECTVENDGSERCRCCRCRRC